MAGCTTRGAGPAIATHGRYVWTILETTNELPCLASTIVIDRDFNECMSAWPFDGNFDFFEVRDGETEEESWFRFLQLDDLATCEDMRLAAVDKEGDCGDAGVVSGVNVQ